MTWHVWTDGSCVNAQDARKHATPKGGRGYGGWAAIIEHDSDGYVVRGRENDTTNVVMELVAVIEGLRTIRDGEPVVVHTDSTVILSVLDRWQRNLSMQGKLTHLWCDLRDEFARLGSVRVEMVVRGAKDPVHNRAHAIAGAEAKALLHIAGGRIPPEATPLDADDRRILGDRFKRQVREWRDQQSRAKPLPSPR